jgi:hypothetical protein
MYKLNDELHLLKSKLTSVTGRTTTSLDGINNEYSL